MEKEKVFYSRFPLAGEDMRAGRGNTRGGQGDQDQISGATNISDVVFIKEKSIHLLFMI